jgi:hypothetical protein
MVQNERGIALIVVLLIAVLLSLLALSLTMSSMSEQRISTEFESHEKALLVADAGLENVRSSLRGEDLDDLLVATASVPSYLPDSDPRPFAYRNPINLREARNIDFDSPPSGTHRADHGWLTSAGGEVIGEGRYFAKLSDNQDGDGNEWADSDGIVCLRIIGVHPSLAETASYGSARKNAVAVVEAVLERDTTFDLQAPLTIPASDTVNPFGGAKFKVDGYDHSSIWQTTDDIGDHDDTHLPDHPGVNVVYDAPPTNSSATVQDIIDNLKENEKDNFTGTGGTPSIVDGTVDVKADPEARKILDANFLDKFVSYVGVYADEKVPPGQGPVGGLGTKENPRTVLAEGDLKLTGNTTGYGLLVVKGELDTKGTFGYNGMVLVIGKGSLIYGGSASILGGVVIANITPSKTLGTANISVHGGGNDSAGIYNSSDKIALGLSLLPMRTISWREITPEVEP